MAAVLSHLSVSHLSESQDESQALCNVPQRGIEREREDLSLNLLRSLALSTI